MAAGFASPGLLFPLLIRGRQVFGNSLVGLNYLTIGRSGCGSPSRPFLKNENRV